MTKVALDLGGSTVRTKEDGVVHRMPSKFQEVNINSRVFKDVEDKTMDFTIMEAPIDSIINKRYARGDATNFLRGVDAQVDNQMLKVDQQNTYVNAAHALAIMVNNKQISKDTPITVGVCIPTSEFYSEGADRVKSALLGSYKLKFNILDKEVEFTVGDVKVFPEGVVALLKMLKGPHAAVLTQKTGIVIDAGRRSTDVTILTKMRPNGVSARSLPIGGLNLESLVSSELEKAGYMVSGSELDRAISEGVISDGKKTVEIGKYVQDAKKILAGYITEKLPSVLSNAAMSIRELNYVVYMGRCFNFASEKENPKYTGDLGEYVLDNLNVALTRIDAEDMELANLNAVYSAITRAA